MKGAGRFALGTSASASPAFRIVDRYVLRAFLFYLLVLVASFVMIWFVFSFFELLSDMLERGKIGAVHSLCLLSDPVLGL